MESILSIDQGTTSTRAMVFSAAGDILAVAQREYAQSYPHAGWVEQDAETIWQDTLAVVRDVLARAGQVRALGITNQRETLVIWNRNTGAPVHPAIVWQDRRSWQKCAELAAKNDWVHGKTGLRIDPYFTATKLQWVLENVPHIRECAEAGELAAGTVDAYLLYRLTAGRVCATDATNASRTLLYNITEGRWDEELLRFFTIPRALLPEVKDSVDDYGVTDKTLFGVEIPIRGVIGDQQAASFGQACFKPGMWKSTYGTGCFVMMHTGNKQVVSTEKLLATIHHSYHGKAEYALEGSIFVAGAAVKWLRDKLGLVASAQETENLALASPPLDELYVVPAFTGLGAPYWDAKARAAILGMTLDTDKAQVVRATLESIAFQTRDLLEAFARDVQGNNLHITPHTLRVDGGMATNNAFCQMLADYLAMPVERPEVVETTALGAAYCAGLGIGIFKDKNAIVKAWQCNKRFEPALCESVRQTRYKGWLTAVEKVREYGQAL